MMLRRRRFWGGPSFALPYPHSHLQGEVSGQGTVLLAAGEDVDFEAYMWTAICMTTWAEPPKVRKRPSLPLVGTSARRRAR